jgi:hypothetical protein
LTPGNTALALCRRAEEAGLVAELAVQASPVGRRSGLLMKTRRRTDEDP